MVVFANLSNLNFSLICFFSVTFGMVSTDMYYLNKIMSNLFLETPVSEKKSTNFVTMNSIADFWMVNCLICIFSICLETDGEGVFFCSCVKVYMLTDRQITASFMFLPMHLGMIHIADFRNVSFLSLGLYCPQHSFLFLQCWVMYTLLYMKFSFTLLML